MKREIKYVVNTQILYKLQNIVLTIEYSQNTIFTYYLLNKKDGVTTVQTQTNKQTNIIP